MPSRFPKYRPDGSFCVKLILEVKTDDPDKMAIIVQHWLDEWVLNNQTWNWFERTLHYRDDFRRSPFNIECSTSWLSFCLEGQPRAEWWKDWIGFHLLQDLQAAFIEIGALRKIIDCDEM